MQIYVETQRGERYRITEGWASAPTIFENDLSADLLATFPTSALDKIFEAFLGPRLLNHSFEQVVGNGDLLHTRQFPGAPRTLPMTTRRYMPRCGNTRFW